MKKTIIHVFAAVSVFGFLYAILGNEQDNADKITTKPTAPEPAHEIATKALTPIDVLPTIEIAAKESEPAPEPEPPSEAPAADHITKTENDHSDILAAINRLDRAKDGKYLETQLRDEILFFKRIEDVHILSHYAEKNEITEPLTNVMTALLNDGAYIQTDILSEISNTLSYYAPIAPPEDVAITMGDYSLPETSSRSEKKADPSSSAFDKKFDTLLDRIDEILNNRLDYKDPFEKNNSAENMISPESF